MREEILFTLETPYRTPLPVRGWSFGDPEKRSLAVLGALRGNEVQQMYVCSRLIRLLADLEAAGELAADCGILVIPCANQFSMNVGRRFWAADNTDINRMFPGYDQGETTQRIAARIFTALQGYRYGVHFTSFHLPGDLLPHARITETGYERAEEALDFGLPYVILRRPHPYDTTTLNFNWQIWDTQAYSLYTQATDSIDTAAAGQAVDAVARFLYAKGMSRRAAPAAPAATVILREEALHSALTTAGGLLLRRCAPGDRVGASDVLGQILEPCAGTVLEELRADCPGTIFFAHRARLINGHEAAFRIIPAKLSQRT